MRIFAVIVLFALFVEASTFGILISLNGNPADLAKLSFLFVVVTCVTPFLLFIKGIGACWILLRLLALAGQKEEITSSSNFRA
jgi:hypothetical protein